MIFQPDKASLNKKEAKAVVARHALHQMGILKSPHTTNPDGTISM